jgi:hypothetical protein
MTFKIGNRFRAKASLIRTNPDCMSLNTVFTIKRIDGGRTAYITLGDG